MILRAKSDTTIGQTVGLLQSHVTLDLWCQTEVMKVLVTDGLAFYASQRDAEPTGPIAWTLYTDNGLELDQGVWG